jgi:acyl-coenzyme A synthetase/AMP-(fatty) acid ligase
VVSLTNGGTPTIPLPGVSVTIYTDSGHTQQAAGTGTVVSNNLGNAQFNLLAGGQFYWVASLTGYGSISGSISVA